MIPKIAVPKFPLVVPSTGQEIFFRPFLVKEEKILLMAIESKDEKAMIQAVKDIIQNCTFDALNVNNLAPFDIEYIFLRIRAKSKGEIIPLEMVCQQPKDKAELKEGEDPTTTICGKQSKIDFNLELIEIMKQDYHTPKIMVEGDIGVVMKYPTFATFEKLKMLSKKEGENISFKEAFDAVIDCIECIFQGETVYPANEASRQELVDFVESLTEDQFGKIEEFFKSMPLVIGKIPYVCPCGKFKETIEVTGLSRFLA